MIVPAAAVPAPTVAHPAHDKTGNKSPPSGEEFLQAVAGASQGSEAAPKRAVVDKSLTSAEALAAKGDAKAAADPHAKADKAAPKTDGHGDHAPVPVLHKPQTAVAPLNAPVLTVAQTVIQAADQMPASALSGKDFKAGEDVAVAGVVAGAGADQAEAAAVGQTGKTAADAHESTATLIAETSGGVAAVAVAAASTTRQAVQTAAGTATQSASPAVASMQTASSSDVSTQNTSATGATTQSAGQPGASAKKPSDPTATSEVQAVKTQANASASAQQSVASAAMLVDGAANAAGLPATPQQSKPGAPTGLGMTLASLSTGTTTNAAAATQPGAAAPQNAISNNAGALAAAVTAMAKDGQNSITVRLDPPDLGSVAIRIAQGHDATMNVLLLAAVPQTAHAFTAGADELRQAFAASGLSLGQLNIGSGQPGSQQSFQQSSRQSWRSQKFTHQSGQLDTVISNSQQMGVRAIA